MSFYNTRQAAAARRLAPTEHDLIDMLIDPSLPAPSLSPFELSLLKRGLAVRAGLHIYKQIQHVIQLAPEVREERARLLLCLWDSGATQVIDETLLADCIARHRAVAAQLVAIHKARPAFSITSAQTESRAT